MLNIIEADQPLSDRITKINKYFDEFEIAVTRKRRVASDTDGSVATDDGPR